MLAKSPALPKSIYDEGEELFGAAEREALIDVALTLGAQPGWVPQKPVFTYGLGLTRYNKVEGLSSGLAVRQSLDSGTPRAHRFALASRTGSLTRSLACGAATAAACWL